MPDIPPDNMGDTLNQQILDQNFAELMLLLRKKTPGPEELKVLQEKTQAICALLKLSTPALAKKYEMALRDAISLLENAEMDLADRIDRLKSTGDLEGVS